MSKFMFLLNKSITLIFLISCSPNVNLAEPIVVKSATYIEPQTITPIIDMSCANDMEHVSGLYCKNIKYTCLEWLDKKRCKKFSQEYKCNGIEKQLNFCMDKEEAHNTDGTPFSNITWNKANAICKTLNKRLCTEDEFVKACSGTDNLPYPYGYERVAGKCNVDHYAHVKDKKLVNQSSNINEYPECISGYGIHNLVGNVDEWYRSDGTSQYQSILRGGFWGYVRGRCDYNSRTSEHFEEYSDTQTGFRCCSNIND